ncbi:MAG TPA: HAMP domain-containing protein [Planctomycetota bacterium]|nr:HAMP domain-containing protein [Planctomycetota bacterium]
MASATVVLGITGVVDWSLESARVRGERDGATQATLERLSVVLLSAIEDLDTEVVRNAVVSELTNSYVAALTVMVGGKVLASHQRPGAASTGGELRRALTRVSDGGEIILRIDPQPLARAQTAVVVQTVISMVAINLLIALAVSLVVSRLTRPITALTRAAQAIADGDLAAPLPAGDGNDEVAVLARAFAAMRDAIRH